MDRPDFIKTQSHLVHFAWRAGTGESGLAARQASLGRVRRMLEVMSIEAKKAQLFSAVKSQGCAMRFTV